MNPNTMRPYVKADHPWWPVHEQSWTGESGELLPSGYRHIKGINRHGRRMYSAVFATREQRKAYTSRRDLKWVG